jgi:predicted RNA binding protein YcfA (HicA-like mRNA interferase family)
VRLPRDWGEEKLAQHLLRFGYEVTRQTGSHMRLTTHQGGEHHVTIPRPSPLRVGTLNGHPQRRSRHFYIERNGALEDILELAGCGAINLDTAAASRPICSRGRSHQPS